MILFKDDDGGVTISAGSVTLLTLDPVRGGVRGWSLEFGYSLLRDIQGWTMGITLVLNARGFVLIPGCVSVSSNVSDPRVEDRPIPFA